MGKLRASGHVDSWCHRVCSPAVHEDWARRVRKLGKADACLAAANYYSIYVNPAHRREVPEYARSMVASYIALVSDTGSGDDILACMREAAAGSVRGDREGAPQSSVVVFYSQADAGEANVQPKQRMPSLRKEHYLRFMDLVMQRNAELGDGDVYVINDCGKEGNKSTLLLSPFPGNMSKKAKRLALFFSEDKQSLAPLQNLYLCEQEAATAVFTHEPPRIRRSRHFSTFARPSSSNGHPRRGCAPLAAFRT